MGGVTLKIKSAQLKLELGKQKITKIVADLREIAPNIAKKTKLFPFFLVKASLSRSAVRTDFAQTKRKKNTKNSVLPKLLRWSHAHCLYQNYKNYTTYL